MLVLLDLEVYCAAVSVADAVLWRCECHRELAYYAEVCFCIWAERGLQANESATAVSCSGYLRTLRRITPIT